MITSTAQKVLEERYFLEGETKWEHLTTRVSSYLGNTEEEAEVFKGLMDRMEFLPNSPCLMNAGTSIKSFSACYVLEVDDSIESIYDFYKDAAIISKSGGGVGCNYSPIRAKGTRVNSTDGVASGPLSFMKVQDVSTDIIKQGGRRRGANMSVLMCDHDDIWDFVAAKDDDNSLENFNLSVGITDEFMSTIVESYDIDDFENAGVDESLVDNNNNKLWEELTQRAWSSAEPGVLFMDTIEKGNTVPELYQLVATNPCGEQPLGPNESCLVKGTLVTTPDGVRKIEDVESTPHVIGTDYKAHTYGKVVCKGIQPVVELHLSNRSTLRCTNDHKIQLVDGSFVEAKDTLGKEVKVLSGSVPYTIYDSPSELHEMLGWLHGDGWYSTTVGISFNKNDGDFEVKDRLSSKFIEVFDVTTKASVDTEDRYQHQSDKKASMLVAESFGMIKGKHTDIEFPSTFYSWTDAQQRSFIRGLFSADAGIGGRANTQISFATSSEKLAKQVVAYLNSVGIHTSKYTTVFNSNRNNQYRVQITKQSANLYMDDIGFLTKVKTDKFVYSRYSDEVCYEVVHISDEGISEVYDIIDVSTVSTFWANGVAVHNCTLGSINLSKFVKKAHPKATLCTTYEIDWLSLSECIEHSVLFLNRILDYSEMPTEKTQIAMERTRKIGLGIMGLHDMLIALEVPYDSSEGREIAEDVMEYINNLSHMYSEDLGEKEGYYSAYESGKGMPERRNVITTTIAPTGTLSMLASCSSGCEPYYSPVVYKTVLDGTTFEMPNAALKQFADDRDTTIEVALLEHGNLFKGANEIHWRDHVLMQSVLQKHVDSSISKTINMSNEATVEDVRGAYELAYKTGCKGVTVYRDGSKSEQVLSTSSKQEEDVVAKEETRGELPEDVESIQEWPPELFKLDLPDIADSKRHRVTVDGQKAYVNITLEDGVPLEIFTKFAYEADPVWNTLCRQLSLSMRYGVPLVDIVKQLDKSVVGVGDMSAKISRALKCYLPKSTMGADEAGVFRIREVNTYGGTESTMSKAEEIVKGNTLPPYGPLVKGDNCPTCGQDALVHQGGCSSCLNCGWEKCS